MKLRGNTKIMVLLVVVVLALAGVGSVALAKGATANSSASYTRFTTRVAQLLGKQPAEVQTAMNTASNEMVDQAVADGRVSKERADAIKSGTAAGAAPWGRWRGMGEGIVGAVKSVQGNNLVITTPGGERKVVLSAGTVYRKGCSSAVKAAVVVGATVRVRGAADDQNVVQADLVSVDTAQDCKDGRRHGVGAMKNLAGEFAAVAKLLGLSEQALQDRLHNGESLATIAGTQKTPQVIELLVKGAGAQLDEAVTDGRLTASQAAAKKATLRDRVTKLVNGQMQFRGGHGRH